MREDINFDELIDKIDFILNSSKPLPHYMKEERELAELVKHLKEIPKYETLKQFELLFDVDPFLMHFLAGTDFTKLLKIIDRTTMKYKHLDGLWIDTKLRLIKIVELRMTLMIGD